MSEKFQNKYRIPSARLQTWDYSWVGAYFITICIKDRLHYFGEIENGEMLFNEIGQIAAEEWVKSPEMRPDMNLSLGDFVVMPNHFHGILVIGKNEYNCRDAMHCAPTIANTDPKQPLNQFGPQRKNVSSVIRGFKSSVTKNARLINPDFSWQSRFYDHIIRDEASFDRIAKYIRNNPAKWDEDKFYN